MKINKPLVKNVVAVSVVIFCLYVISGGFYNQLIKPTNYARLYGHLYTIDPQIQHQTTSESAKAFLCNLTTIMGISVAASSSHKSLSPVTTYRLLLIGVGLLLFSVIGLYYLLDLKISAVPIR